MFSSTLIEIPQWHGITILEAIWTVVGLITVILVLCMLKIVTEGWLSTPEGTIERDASRAYVRREVIRLLQGLCVFGVGIYVTFWVDSPPGPAYTTIAGLIVVIALFAIAILVALQSLWDWQARNRIIKELRQKGVHL